MDDKEILEKYSFRIGISKSRGSLGISSSGEMIHKEKKLILPIIKRIMKYVASDEELYGISIFIDLK